MLSPFQPKVEGCGLKIGLEATDKLQLTNLKVHGILKIEPWNMHNPCFLNFLPHYYTWLFLQCLFTLESFFTLPKSARWCEWPLFSVVPVVCSAGNHSSSFMRTATALMYSIDPSVFIPDDFFMDPNNLFCRGLWQLLPLRKSKAGTVLVTVCRFHC